ncbi:BMP family ABC transporter substrate-binding protein [Nocardioides sp. CER19]|uniref:BMP family lipoprotein n=1 Tax=Nocardioides sp. CER19 TaxID=3038538 RepID=UPI00244B1A2F|nr:BMP family ABC transporter substrate-binding protein [Nocardioides sp. CER19]MDH2413694.1 BMP family ABC transporter substrate-binding protein [Nocardioides sp. CER19]
MRRSTKFAAVLTAGILSVALTACGGGSDNKNSANDTGSSGGKSDIKVGMAYDIGGRGDQSFNDMAAAGLDKAKSEFGIKTSESEATPDEAESAKEDRLIQLADAGYNPVIAVGFAYSEAVGKVAKQYPDVKFAIIDDTANTDKNVTNLVFAEEQGSFLVGAAAALKSKAGHIGFVGGVNTPLINKFEAGYDAGAKAVNPSIKIESAYLTQPPDFTGFNDPGKGKTAAEGQFDAGADVVYHAAGGSGLGVFQAAKAAKGLAIGVDSDQYLTASADLQPFILTSMIKHVDVAVYNFIKSVKDGDPLTGTVTFDLKAGGVDFSTSGGQVDDIKSKLDDFKKQIIDGTIKVPTTVK